MALASALKFSMSSVGYTEKEFILTGSAASYASQENNSLGVDGKWAVEKNDSAAYTTRAIVYRPIDEAEFNGTVIVEWMNVTSGSDSSPVWIYTHNELIREGYVLISLSVQAAGIASTQRMDSERYSELLHPGDNYSYDIFSQVGQAVRTQADVLLEGLCPERVIAAGESQSAYRLVTYLNAIHLLKPVYDGYLLQSRPAKGAPLAILDDVAGATQVRADLGVPVLVFQTETDINPVTRQADTATYRLWEVAGTAHFDAYGGGLGLLDVGDVEGAASVLYALRNPPATVFGFICCNKAINAGPMTFVLSAALHALNEWIKTGLAPCSVEQLQATNFTLYNPCILRDELGNARGGIRTPFVEVPLAALAGTGNSGSQDFCMFFGTTEPYTPARLYALYPNSKSFLEKWSKATTLAMEQGVIRPADAKRLIAAVEKLEDDIYGLPPLR